MPTSRVVASEPSGTPSITALMLFPFQGPHSALQSQRAPALGISTNYCPLPWPGIVRFRRSSHSESMRFPSETPSGVSSEDAGLAIIRKAAEATLAAWPEAEAAVLFGSRAAAIIRTQATGTSPSLPVKASLSGLFPPDCQSLGFRTRWIA